CLYVNKCCAYNECVGAWHLRTPSLPHIYIRKGQRPCWTIMCVSVRLALSRSPASDAGRTSIVVNRKSPAPVPVNSGLSPLVSNGAGYPKTWRELARVYYEASLVPAEPVGQWTLVLYCQS